MFSHQSYWGDFRTIMRIQQKNLRRCVSSKNINTVVSKYSIATTMYSADIRTRVSDYDRLRTQNMRMKNLMKKSQKLKDTLKRQSRNDNKDSSNCNTTAPSPAGRRNRSASPHRTMRNSDTMNHSLVDPSMFW